MIRGRETQKMEPASSLFRLVAAWKFHAKCHEAEGPGQQAEPLACFVLYRRAPSCSDPGPNPKTEVDTTVFGNIAILSNGLVRTTGAGKKKLSMLKKAILSGPTFPFHIVTTDGAGLHPSRPRPNRHGQVSNGTFLELVTWIPGESGNIKSSFKSKQGRWLLGRALVKVGVIGKRAAKVNEDFLMAFAVPDGMRCEGTVAGINNFCLVKG